MRMESNGRKMLVSKAELLKTIAENKEKHVTEYAKAVEAYKKEAYKQLEELSKQLDNGKLNIKLNLITPENKADEYDKLTTMFSWELKDEVELSQGEFNEYVLDESSFARQARLSNATYMF